MKTYLSREAAIANLRKFFPSTTGDEVSVEDIFIAVGRGSKSIKENRSWLSNKLTSMQEYGLFTRGYSSRGGQRKLVKLKLTSEGRRVLGRDGSDQLTVPLQMSIRGTQGDRETVTVSSVLHHVELLRKNEPKLDITFDVKLKEENIV